MLHKTNSRAVGTMGKSYGSQYSAQYLRDLGRSSFLYFRDQLRVCYGAQFLYLMNQSEGHSQTIGNSSGPLSPSSIRTDNHRLLVYQDFEISISLGMYSLLE